MRSMLERPMRHFPFDNRTPSLGTLPRIAAERAGHTGFAMRDAALTNLTWAFAVPACIAFWIGVLYLVFS
jgi:hypothetical protein